MDFHIRGGLLSGCLTSIECLHDILPWSVRDLLTTWWHSTSSPHGGDCLPGECLALEEEHLAFQRRDFSPRQHEVAWMLAWRHGVDLGMLGLQQLMQGEWTTWLISEALESSKAWRRSVGHIS
jgi:hypothetical protein